MKKGYRFIWLSLAAAMIFSFGIAEIRAQDPQISIGAGIGFAPDYEGSDDYEAIPIITARAGWASGRYLLLTGTSLRANLMDNETWHVGPVLQYRFERDDVENKAVDRMRKVDGSLEAGGFIGFSRNNWNGLLQVVQDVSDGHDGLLARLEGGYTLSISDQLRVSVDASATWASDDYMDAYFSVDADNAIRSGLRRYEAEGGFKDVGLDFVARYEFSPDWTLWGLISYTRLIGDAEDSPLTDGVGDPNQYFGGIAVNYSF